MTGLAIASTLLPAWTAGIQDRRDGLDTDDQRMALAIELARRNVEHGTGGPFGAAIFDVQGRLISFGVNRVVPTCDPTAHAEGVAIRLACASHETHNLADRGEHVLYTSAQPCAMCATSLIWAGISKVVIGASAEDTERMTGFDEGLIPHNWREGFAKRGITVIEAVQRDKAIEVFDLYVKSGGFIYNGGNGSQLRAP